MKLLLSLVLLAVLFPQHSVLGARILAMFPIPAKSHHILINAMVRALVSKGHEVVLYTPYQWDRPVANVTVVHLDNIVSMDLSITKETIEQYMNYSPVGLTLPLLETSGGLIENVYKNKHIRDLIDSDDHFDLVLMESFYSQEPFLAFGKKFNAPVISMHPFGAYSLVNKVMGNPLNLAFIPDFGIPISDKMSFLERLMNSYSILRPMYTFYNQHLPAKTKLMREIFKDPTLPPVEELIQNISLVFNNAHPNVHYIQPYVANVVPIGGIHLQTENKPLPPAIKEFLDEAPEGVIYFSLGSIMPDEKLGEEYFAKFLNVFRRLPQRILWKTNANLRDLPNNVMTAKWIPQQDVLAHPNVRVFMTHGGIFSQHEAIYAGVPVVCTPFMCDQPMNAKFYEDKEIGVRLFYDSLSEETIQKALTTVLGDPKYQENMARMSRVYRDRPISPADSLVYWVEYTIRHKGAHHLRPASASMPFYQVYLLDIIGTILFALIITSFIGYTIIMLLFRKLLKIHIKYSKVIHFLTDRRNSIDAIDLKFLSTKLD